jgi:hypothetical protein
VTPHFDAGEQIETHLLNLKDLYATLLGPNDHGLIPLEFTKKGFAVDARLFHLALGLQCQ